MVVTPNDRFESCIQFCCGMISLLPIPPCACASTRPDDVGRIAPAVRRRIQDETGGIRRFVNVFVGEDECRTLDGLDTRVPAGTVLYVIPSVAGG